ncbi:lysozyme inhibitor LprI family protein [Exiguobacterium artemiae]|uniref:lysozyme inhibitor LprI family protein n=1 Tax=Exiguobacterium artemiae TaxID=340145 RepID=UPI00047B3D7D|nr:lysozyme inhibitor LprI family protein [Exiguobacterium sibiricum]
MSLKKVITLLGMMFTVLLLAACNDSVENNIIGSWKVVSENKTLSYIQISEKRYTIRSIDEDPQTADYIITETEDDSFIFDVINPESGSNKFLFEGHFENDDKISLLRNTNGRDTKSVLIRVDSISEEMKKQALKEEKEKKVQQEKEEQLAKEEEAARQEENESTLQEEEQEQDQNDESNMESTEKTKYLQRADALDEKILAEGKKLYEQDLPTGFYGQYYEKWDNLLNDMWAEIKTQKSAAEFELLRQDQSNWIDQKEKGFSEIPDEPASERARGMDFLTFETKNRVYFLIENHSK